jgi:microcystin-dependent protein
MGEPFLAEIRLFSFNFAPQGWAFCNGQLLPINQNQALFALLGTTYGGNGQTNFALPDLRDKVPIHFGSGFDQGQTGGEDAHTLSISEMPEHTHSVNARTPPDGSANTNNPVGAFLSNSAPNELYQTGGGSPAVLAMAPGTIANVGGSQAHENRMPYLALTFCIALQGIFPAQN